MATSQLAKATRQDTIAPTNMISTRHVILVAAACAAAGCTLDGTADVPGDVRRFDSVAQYPAVAAFAGNGAKLLKLEAQYVREDGTQDLEATYIKAFDGSTYDFVRPKSGPADDAPVGARATNSPFEAARVTIGKPHSVHSQGAQNGTFTHRGMQVQGGWAPGNSKDVVPPPACSFAKLWAAAKHHNAPQGAVAKITYDKDGYDFRIDGTDVEVKFDASCRVKK